MSKHGRAGIQWCDFDTAATVIRFRRVRLPLYGTLRGGTHSDCRHARRTDGLRAAKS